MNLTGISHITKLDSLVQGSSLSSKFHPPNVKRQSNVSRCPSRFRSFQLGEFFLRNKLGSILFQGSLGSLKFVVSFLLLFSMGSFDVCIHLLDSQLFSKFSFSLPNGGSLSCLVLSLNSSFSICFSLGGNTEKI